MGATSELWVGRKSRRHPHMSSPEFHPFSFFLKTAPMLNDLLAVHPDSTLLLLPFPLGMVHQDPWSLTPSRLSRPMLLPSPTTTAKPEPFHRPPGPIHPTATQDTFLVGKCLVQVTEIPNQVIHLQTDGGRIPNSPLLSLPHITLWGATFPSPVKPHKMDSSRWTVRMALATWD